MVLYYNISSCSTLDRPADTIRRRSEEGDGTIPCKARCEYAKVYTRADGKSRRLTVGRHGLISAEQARHKAVQVIDDIQGLQQAGARQRRLERRRCSHGRRRGGVAHARARDGALQAHHGTALSAHARPTPAAGAGSICTSARLDVSGCRPNTTVCTGHRRSQTKWFTCSRGCLSWPGGGVSYPRAATRAGS